MAELKLLCDKRDKKDTPQRVFSILLGAVSELLMVKQLKADGLSAEEISGYYERKVPMFVVNKAIKQSRKFEEDFFRRLSGKVQCMTCTQSREKWTLKPHYSCL